MTPCRRVRNDQLATLKQHGGRRRRPSGLWSICISGDRCGDAVGFSVSTRRQCYGRRQAERDRQKIAAIPASASILPRSWHWAELRLPPSHVGTRMVSAAGIRLDPRKTARPFKGIFCDDISEFASHAVGSLWRVYPVHGLCEQRQIPKRSPLTVLTATGSNYFAF